MRSQSKTAAVVLAGAVAVASAAYGIGTQTGGGTATAGGGLARDGGSRGDCERGLRFGFGGLASELGVEAAELRQALEEFHERSEGEHRDAFAAALAEALGKSTADVEAAFKKVRPGDHEGRHGHPALSLRRLARALDVTRAELRRAFGEVRAGAESAWEERRAELVTFLAERFGLSEEKVEEALPEFRGPGWHGPGRHGPGRPGGSPFGP